MRTIRALAAAAVLAGLLAASGPASAKIMELTLLSQPEGLFLDDTDHLAVCGALISLSGEGGGGASTGGLCNFTGYYLKTSFVYNSNGGQVLSAKMSIFGEPPAIPDSDNTGFLLASVDLNTANGSVNAYPDTYAFGVSSEVDDPPYTDMAGVYHDIGVVTTTLFEVVFPTDGLETLDQDRLYHPTFADDLDDGLLWDILLYKYSYTPGDNYDFPTIYDVHFDGGHGDGLINTYTVSFKDITPNGVPEPASWALMLLGFGGLGAALRRRRAAGIAA